MVIQRPPQPKIPISIIDSLQNLDISGSDRHAIPRRDPVFRRQLAVFAKDPLESTAPEQDIRHHIGSMGQTIVGAGDLVRDEFGKGIVSDRGGAEGVLVS